MTDEIVEILLRAAGRADESGDPYVSSKHMRDDEIRSLCEDAIRFLRAKKGTPSPIEGWNQLAASQAGLLPYWTAIAGWDERMRRRFQPLRRVVYDDLEGHGLLFKPPGAGASLHVSPTGSMADEARDLPVIPAQLQPSTKRSPSVSAPSLRDQVEETLRDRMTALIEAIRAQTSITAEDYAAVLAGQSALDVLVRFTNDLSTTSTTRGLCKARRPDLTVEQAVVDWSADLPLPTIVVENAAGRLAYWSVDD